MMEKSKKQLVESFFVKYDKEFINNKDLIWFLKAFLECLEDNCIILDDGEAFAILLAYPNLVAALKFIYNNQLFQDKYSNNNNFNILFATYLENIMYLTGKKCAKQKYNPNTDRALILAAQANDQSAIETLYNHNINLIKYIASKYANENLSVDDLIQEGSIGFLTAIKKFDVNYGTSFMSYLYYWIHQAIQRSYCSQSSPIRLPVHVIEAIGKYSRLFPDGQGDMSDAEVAKKLGCSVNLLNSIKNIPRVSVSLNVNLFDEEKSELGNVIPDGSESIEDDVEKKLISQELWDLLSRVSLSARERKVFLYYHGFMGRNYSLEEIAKMYGVGRERIRQIDDGVLRRLANNSELKKYFFGEKDPIDISLDRLINCDKAAKLMRVIEELPENDQSLIFRAYGKTFDDLELFKSLTEEEKTYLKNVLIPKIKRLFVEYEQSFYYQFWAYSKVMVNHELSLLTIDEIAVIQLEYDSDLKKKANKRMQKEEREKYDAIIKKMRQNLKQAIKDQKQKPKQEKPKVSKRRMKVKNVLVLPGKEKQNNNDSFQINPEATNESTDIKKDTTLIVNLSTEEITAIFNFLYMYEQIPFVTDLSKLLTEQELFIYLLAVGAVHNKKYSDAEISYILSLSLEKTQELLTAIYEKISSEEQKINDLLVNLNISLK